MSIVFFKQQDNLTTRRVENSSAPKLDCSALNSKQGKYNQEEQSLLKIYLFFCLSFFFFSQVAAIVQVYGLGRVSNKISRRKQ